MPDWDRAGGDSLRERMRRGLRALSDEQISRRLYPPPPAVPRPILTAPTPKFLGPAVKRAGGLTQAGQKALYDRLLEEFEANGKTAVGSGGGGRSDEIVLMDEDTSDPDLPRCSICRWPIKVVDGYWEHEFGQAWPHCASPLPMFLDRSIVYERMRLRNGMWELLKNLLAE